MDFQLISRTSRTLSIEVQNDSCFYNDRPYRIYLDGVLHATTNRNVHTLYGLEPAKRYDVQLKEEGSETTSPVYGLMTKDEPMTLDVRRFGAKGDGETLDTAAIQAAIAACPPYGRVLLPEGVYLSTPLFLKSRMTLELEKGAVLLASTERALYPVLPGTLETNSGEEAYLGSWEGDPQDAFASLLTGIDVEEVVVTGEGILDGQASMDNWWKDAKARRIAWRPRMVFLLNSRWVLVEGLTVRNSPSWNIHPMFSRDLQFINLTIESPKDSPNTDGINPESCEGVLICGVHFSVGDDCIALKSGKMYLGKKLKRPSENIIVRNCRMADGHGAIVIGSEMSGGILNVSATQCVFHRTDRGIRIKTRRGRGREGVIRGIKAENIRMEGVLTPFVINAFYFCDTDGKTEYVWSKEALPVDDGTPAIENIYYKNIVAKDAEVSAGFFYGLPEKKIENIHLEDIRIAFKKDSRTDYPAMMSHIEKSSKGGFFIGNARGVTIRNVTIEGVEGEGFQYQDVENLHEQQE
ncbi:glycoside hydrolase family 28 protein [Anaerotalea alkaliphila]|uniref:Glycoside hydrolase family 28 protein n=1 Tax=Anaerotalea alkaliphila TaxID=2662126 RepID=A0A7X5HUV2_9FIRM|nr:glycoside hydrolase family 28 protein [Anaerotalea alkaliphila]NDL67087.1 glycoside hydrolase family 28 protein [Anaerotalea alkaliphila]